MDAYGVLIVLLLACACSGTLVKRFEYKHSFKGPHLTQRDETIPFWTYGGDALASDDFVRLTPSLKSQKGWIWNKIESSLSEWEVEATLRISGRGRIGADGLAIWFTEQQGTAGPVFGSSDKWKGLAVVLDSFDNDGLMNNPHIGAIVNDGTSSFDHSNDGTLQQLGGCTRDYRNKPYPMKLKIEYKNKALTVLVHSGMTNEYTDTYYEMCLRAENVELPPKGFFGLSAATGGLADDHDVLSLLTHSYHAEDQAAKQQQIADEEKKKYETEFQQYEQKLEQAKEEYKKEHGKEEEGKKEEQYESESSRELRAIYEGQARVRSDVVDINRRIDELLGSQSRVLSQLTAMAASATSASKTENALAQRQDVDQLVVAHKDLTKIVKELRTTLDDVHRLTSAVSAGANQQHPDTQQASLELKDGVKDIKANVQSIVSRLQAQQGAVNVCSNCLTPTVFFALAGTQLALFGVYVMYQHRRETASKKFY